MEKSEVLRLNVGGHIYNTTKATLVKYPNSTLGVMFNEDTPFSTDQDGNYFIDRDGQMFRYILNFCRSGKLCLPQHFSDYDLLENEADFYQIEPLIASITSLRQQAIKENQGFNYIEIVEEKSNPIRHVQFQSFDFSSDVPVSSTSLYGRIDDLTALPPEFVYLSGNLQTDLSSNYGKLIVKGCDVRIQIGEFLSKRGWVKEHSDLSSSSIASATKDIFKEQTYRDVWKIYRKK